MRLTIDTQKDSHEEIRKAIRMLSALVGEVGNYSNDGSVRSRNIFDDASSVLGSNDSSSDLTSQSSSSAPEQSGGIFGFFDNADKQVMEEKKEEKRSSDKVMEYY